jgi:hypothetical protein
LATRLILDQKSSGSKPDEAAFAKATAANGSKYKATAADGSKYKAHTALKALDKDQCFFYCQFSAFSDAEYV